MSRLPAIDPVVGDEFIGPLHGERNISRVWNKSAPKALTKLQQYNRMIGRTSAPARRPPNWRVRYFNSEGKSYTCSLAAFRLWAKDSWVVRYGRDVSGRNLPPPPQE